MEAIETKAKALQKTADTLYNSGLGEDKQSASYNSYKKAATAAFMLHTTLKDASESYFKDGNKEAFKKIADEAIDAAHQSELKNHRGWKEVLGYTALAVLALLTVATAGIAYVIAGGVNYAVNRQFFFSTTINTDSINKVDDLDKAIDEIGARLFN